MHIARNVNAIEKNTTRNVILLLGDVQRRVKQFFFSAAAIAIAAMWCLVPLENFVRTQTDN